MAFPNKQFKDGDEYHAFGRKYGVWGAQAYTLKKIMDKKTNIPEPRIQPKGKIKK